MISIVIISKDEPELAETLRGVAKQADAFREDCEIVVVDASRGRLSEIRERHPEVRWIDYSPPPDVRVSIPHQRNVGVSAAAGELIVFTDAGCRPQAGWLERLVAPILDSGEQVVAGIAPGPEGKSGLYDTAMAANAGSEYLDDCATINMAFTRAAFDAVGGFDEGFEYGSDTDFSWRLVARGYRIRNAPDSVVEHDWENGGRQLRRAFFYGRARVRLYRRHRARRRDMWRTDPVTLVYPAFLVGLPLTARFPLYPGLLAIPAWRNRSNGAGRVLANHLVFGAGVISELAAR